MAEGVDAAMGPGALVLDLLSGPLAVRPQPEEGVDDARIDAVGTLVAKGQYEQAARVAGQLLGAGLLDVRLVGPYLVGSFLEQGMAALPGVFESVERTLTTNWAAFGPERKKVVIADNAFRWLLKGLLKNIEFHERTRDEAWRGWMEPASLAPVERALDKVPSVEAAFAAVFPPAQGGCVDLFRRLAGWLREHLRAMSVNAAALTAAATAAATGTATAREAAAAGGAAEAVHDEPSGGREAPVLAGKFPARIPVSPALAELIRKLHAFQLLVGRQDFGRAGVVAADVLQVVEQFDPRLYLPSLFLDFFSALSENVEQLEPSLQSADTFAFKTLNQLYRVDLDAFLAQRPPRASEESQDGSDE